jgi:hypothetical protein
MKDMLLDLFIMLKLLVSHHLLYCPKEMGTESHFPVHFLKRIQVLRHGMCCSRNSSVWCAGSGIITNGLLNAKFEVSMALKIQVAVYWVVTPCSVVVGYPADEGSMVLQNGGILPQHYTASSKPRKP